MFVGLVSVDREVQHWIGLLTERASAPFRLQCWPCLDSGVQTAVTVVVGVSERFGSDQGVAPSLRPAVHPQDADPSRRLSMGLDNPHPIATVPIVYRWARIRCGSCVVLP